jgi:FkbM family methyltransferase
MPKVLIHFTHGLGDAVQLTCVFQHLQKYRPDWDLYLQAQRGKHSVGNGYCQRIWHEQEPGPDHGFFHQVFKLDWWENYNAYADCPNTKVTNCLREVFRIQPDPALLRYKLHLGQEALESTGGYLEQIGCRRLDNGRFNAVVLHYQGNTSTHKKNLSDEQAAILCESVIAAGFVPVILDWDRRSPLPDGRRIFSPGVQAGDIWGGFGSGDAERITALISQASLFVGIDSGPQKCAGATDTPAIGVWTGHHPIQFMDLCGNFLHLVPPNHENIPPMQHAGPRSYFHRNYRYRLFTGSHDLTDAALTMLGAEAPKHPDGLVKVGDFWVRDDNTEQDMVVVKDVYQGDCYRISLLGKFADDEVIVDVGAHIGAFAKLWHKRNPRARIICVEACPENLACLQANVGDFATVVHAACTYEEGELALLNAVRPHCESTGGSTVIPADKLDDASLRQPGYEYWHDRRPLRKVTLEELMAQMGVNHIDLLKLDCEGSEFSILEKTPSRSRIHFILGEYHGLQRWDEMRPRVFYGWDYGHMYAHESGLGNFHLCNRVWPPPARSSVQDFLRRHVRSGDEPYFDLGLGYYQALHDLTARFAPNRIVEIGVRAGYSALAMLRAAPQAAVVGFDNDSDMSSAGYVQHARELLKGHNYQLILADSRTLPSLPSSDMVLIDGDHTLPGCLNDLQLASRAAPVILLDDYQEYADNAVRNAIAQWRNSNPGWSLEVVPFGDPHRSVAVLTRNKEKTLRLALPPGIGDAFWCLLKVPALCRREGASGVDVEVCGGPPYRSREFLQAFDFVSSVAHTDLRITEADFITPGGEFNYAPSQPSWHNRFDWLLQVNGHLERGQRIEDWLPDLAIDWNLMERFRWSNKALETAAAVQQQYGDYCVFYTGPESGNTTAGHNRGGLWRPADWVRLAELARAAGLQVLFVGAEYDRSYLANHLLPAGLKDCHDYLGAWQIDETLAVIRGARFYVGYQSGLGIVATYLGVPTAMFWRPYGNSILPDQRVTFREEMASAWAPREHLDRGRYLPCIYGRCSPEGIMEHQRTVWNNLR